MTLTDQIFESIRYDIVMGIHPIGDRLPSERELTEKYNASRFAVREAIAKLIQSGFVATLPQSGTYVLDFVNDGSIETLVQMLRIRRQIDAQTLESLLRFRLQTETEAAAEAAMYINDKDIEYLSDLLYQKESSCLSIPDLVENDYLFHHYVIHISKNTVTQLVFKSFKPVYTFFTEFFYSLEGAKASSQRLNNRLFLVLKQGDSLAAAKAMADVIRNGEKYITSAIKKSEQSKIFLPTGEERLR